MYCMHLYHITSFVIVIIYSYTSHLRSLVSHALGARRQVLDKALLFMLSGRFGIPCIVCILH